MLKFSTTIHHHWYFLDMNYVKVLQIDKISVTAAFIWTILLAITYSYENSFPFSAPYQWINRLLIIELIKRNPKLKISQICLMHSAFSYILEETDVIVWANAKHLMTEAI